MMDFCDTECPACADNTLAGECIPTALELMTLRKDYGVTWACHSDSEKPCKGMLGFMHMKGLSNKVLNKNLFTLQEWNRVGFDNFEGFKENLDKNRRIRCVNF
jgi:hypothetical protein